VKPGDLLETDHGLVSLTGCSSWPIDDWHTKVGRGAQVCGITEDGQVWMGRWLIDCQPCKQEAA
jgi:hypothetical protein